MGQKCSSLSFFKRRRPARNPVWKHLQVEPAPTPPREIATNPDVCSPPVRDDSIRQQHHGGVRNTDTGIPTTYTGKNQAWDGWKFNVQPNHVPSIAQLEKGRKRLQYDDSKIHIAVTGYTGVGKSSLVNALRGAARTSPMETTRNIGRYQDRSYPHVVWYDVPGAGILGSSDWQYFNEQAFYVFDAIIIVFSDRFTETDVAIMKNCAKYNIHSYLVHTKSDIAIRSLINQNKDVEKLDTSQGNLPPDKKLLERCRKQYVEDTEASVSHHLLSAQLGSQRIYHVCEDVLRARVKRHQPPKNICGYELDEKLLLTDLIIDTLRRRFYHLLQDKSLAATVGRLWGTS